MADPDAEGYLFRFPFPLPPDPPEFQLPAATPPPEHHAAPDGFAGPDSQAGSPEPIDTVESLRAEMESLLAKLERLAGAAPSPPAGSINPVRLGPRPAPTLLTEVSPTIAPAAIDPSQDKRPRDTKSDGGPTPGWKKVGQQLPPLALRKDDVASILDNQLLKQLPQSLLKGPNPPVLVFVNSQRRFSLRTLVKEKSLIKDQPPRSDVMECGCMQHGVDLFCPAEGPRHVIYIERSGEPDGAFHFSGETKKKEPDGEKKLKRPRKTTPPDELKPEPGSYNLPVPGEDCHGRRVRRLHVQAKRYWVPGSEFAVVAVTAWHEHQD
jgi:hypothetical protein